MKTWLISIAGLIIFIGLAIFVQYHIQSTSQKLEQDMQKVNASLTRKQWRQTVAELKTIKAKWQKTKPLWAMLIHHREIDSIDQSLVRAMKATQSKNYSESQMELGSLQHFIRHIPERERFNLVNVF